MFSDIILQTFDTFQAEQLNLLKADNIARSDTHHGKQSRDNIPRSAAVSLEPCKQSLSSCGSDHRKRQGERLDGSKIGSVR